jgi:hypothetical protein
MLKKVFQIVTAPFFVIGVILGGLLTVLALASISVGGWSEVALSRVGYREKPRLLPMILGLAGYFGIGIVGLAALGGYLLGWPGAVLGPLLGIVLIAILDRW